MQMANRHRIACGVHGGIQCLIVDAPVAVAQGGEIEAAVAGSQQRLVVTLPAADWNPRRLRYRLETSERSDVKPRVQIRRLRQERDPAPVSGDVRLEEARALRKQVKM